MPITNLQHGHNRIGKMTKLYRAWKFMKQRCNNPNHPKYPGWGGRGISVCDRWSDSFINFMEDMGEPPTPQHSLGRIDNNGNYEPGNVRWETPAQQAQSRRRHTNNRTTNPMRNIKFRHGNYQVRVQVNYKSSTHTFTSLGDAQEWRDEIHYENSFHRELGL